MELKLSDLTKRCGGKEALSHFSYTFENGIYGILGANGAGKSSEKYVLKFLSSVWLLTCCILERKIHTGGTGQNERRIFCREVCRGHRRLKQTGLKYGLSPIILSRASNLHSTRLS